MQFIFKFIKYDFLLSSIKSEVCITSNKSCLNVYEIYLNRTDFVLAGAEVPVEAGTEAGRHVQGAGHTAGG